MDPFTAYLATYSPQARPQIDRVAALQAQERRISSHSLRQLSTVIVWIDSELLRVEAIIRRELPARALGCFGSPPFQDVPDKELRERLAKIWLELCQLMLMKERIKRQYDARNRYSTTRSAASMKAGSLSSTYH